LSGQALGAGSYIVTYAFPNLRTLSLGSCNVDVPTFLASLLACPQLTKLELKHCGMPSSVVAAIPMLRRLPQLRDLVWLEPEHSSSPVSDIHSTVANLAELTQLTALSIGSNRATPASLITLVTRLTQLECIDVGPTCYASSATDDDYTPPTVN
jgi:hypothetical protein